MIIEIEEREKIVRAFITFPTQELHPNFSKILEIFTDQYEFFLIEWRIDLKISIYKSS